MLLAYLIMKVKKKETIETALKYAQYIVSIKLILYLDDRCLK